MPQQPGEVSLLTLFADIHYFFGHPSAKPPHHRFDKTSYVYLFQNPMQQRGRLEVANHAGTPEQDAFNGYLDTVRVERSHKHPLLFTITVDGAALHNGSASSTPSQDMSQWHLPTLDPKNENKYMYKLHTVDMYFWTDADATLFLDSLKRILHEGQLRILDAPAAPPEHKDMMSPVVQKLEQAAISKPYSRDSVSTTHSFPGPPQAATPASSTMTPPIPEQEYAPMAYNPAAPGVPEPIAHREPTPPPLDAANGTGLAVAAIHDQGQYHGGAPHAPYSSTQSSFAPQSTANQPYMPGPPQRQASGSIPPPPGGTPPGPGIQRTNTVATFPPPPPPPGSTGPTATSMSFAPPPTNASAPPQMGLHRQATLPAYSSAPVQQYANYPGSPGHPPAQSPGLSPGFPPTPSYQPVPSPGHPPGGFSTYNYGQSGQQVHDAYTIHQQVYRPTEAEAHSHVKPATPGKAPGKFEQRADKIEKGVTKFLKKLDKKL